MRVARPVVHLFLLFAAALILLFFGAPGSSAQDISSLQNGIVPFGAYDGADFDSVNLSNGNLMLHIPLFNYPQRGTLPGQFQIVANTKSFYVVQSCNPQLQTCTLAWNMNYMGPGIAQVSDELGLQTPWRSKTSNGLRVVSWDGSSHQMWGGQSLDGTGIYMNGAFPPTQFLNRNGNGLPSTSGSITQQDTNGNYFNTSGVDTLGRTISISSFPGPNGSTTQVQFTSVNVTIQTNFNASSNDMYQNLDPIREYGPSNMSLLQSIAVYDGNSWATSPTWTFQYNDRDPGNPSNINYGNVTQITLPTGGTISYTYGRYSPCDGGYLPLTPTSRGVISRTVNANDGTGPHTTTYYPNGTVTDPDGNQTAHTFTALASCSFYETQTQYYQGTVATGHLLKTVQTSYAYKSNPNCVNSSDDCQTVVSVVPTTITTTLDNGLVNQVVNVWDHQTGSGYTYGELLEKQEYDYRNGSPGSLLRKTDYTYLALNNSSYLALNMLDRVSSVIVYNGSGTQVSQTTYGYDETSPVSSGISTNHLSLPSGTLRGNRTSECRWLNTTGGTLCTHITYYDTGMPYQVTDPLGNVTTYSYSSTYAGAYVTQTTMPQTGSVQHTVSSAYDFDTGKLTSFTDQNNQTSSYQYDPLWRMTTTSFPDTGQTTFTYPNLNTIQRQQKINSSVTETSTTIFDGLGRTSQTQLNSDPDCGSSGLGHVSTVSNAYCLTSDPTYGLTTYAYDALGRTTSVTEPDASVISTSYSGNTTTVTDEAGKKRQSTTDGLGHLTQVTEDPGGLGYVTNYGYDALDNLLSVVQNGSRQRTFAYDSLSRLTSAINPESGTTTYSYDYNGNLASKVSPAPNQTGTATVTISYCYDALNRMVSKAYTSQSCPMSSPTATYTYDLSSVDGDPYFQNPVGRLVKAEQFGFGVPVITYSDYDPVGRALHRAQCFWQNCTTFGSSPAWWIVTNTYDLAGDLTSYTDAFGHTLTQTFDNAGRPSQLTSNWVDSTHPATLATVGSPAGALNGYAPAGQLKNLTLANGLTESWFYNNRLQPCRINWNSSATTLAACSGGAPSGNLLDFTYGFVDSNGHNNGNVAFWSAVGQQSFTRSFQYDSLNRIAQMQETGGNAESCKPASSPSTPYTISWTIDPWGNRTNQSPSAGTCSFSQPVNAKNQFSGGPYQYDAAGNMTYDGIHTYFYDAENHLVQVDGSSLGSVCSTTATACYLYNTDGQRVYKYMSNGANTTSYIYGSDGQVVSYTDTSGNWNLTYLHFGGTLLGEYAGTGTYFIHRDHLGSTRLGTDLNHNVTANYDYLPFGEQLTGGNESLIKFTGKERDPESGLDNFGARYDSSSMGRFMSPDWSDDPDPIPNADLGNPQTLNLYAYVGNNPVNFTDDDGHDPDGPNPAGTCGWLCRFFNLFRNSHSSSTEQAGLTPLPFPGRSPIPPFRPPVTPTPPVRPPVVEPPPVPPVVTVGGLIALDAALLVYDSYEGYKLYRAFKLSENRSGTEPTPDTHPSQFENVKNSPAKRNKITGEYWEKDKSRHGGDHYEVYKDKRSWENRNRDRAVDPTGRTIRTY